MPSWSASWSPSSCLTHPAPCWCALWESLDDDWSTRALLPHGGPGRVWAPGFGPLLTVRSGWGAGQQISVSLSNKVKHIFCLVFQEKKVAFTPYWFHLYILQILLSTWSFAALLAGLPPVAPTQGPIPSTHLQFKVDAHKTLNSFWLWALVSFLSGSTTISLSLAAF